jgi:cytochrome P450
MMASMSMPSGGAAAPLLVPPAPAPPEGALSARELIAAFRTNALRAWPRHAYETDIAERRFFGRSSVLVNAPEGIRRVLVDNHANYRRTPASVRILRPVMGDGLFISDGDAWRHQRRTLAPAFTPKAVRFIVPHVLACAGEALALLDARREGPVDLLAAMQRLALEVAGRTMFSLETRAHGEELRWRLASYAAELGRPRLLDFLLPLAIPSPQDLRRRRFSRAWMALVERLMAERRQAPPADAPRDLYDLLVAARDPETGAAFTAAQLRDQVATLILAGHETTAVALFWSLYLLALAPAAQERVAAEAASLDPASPDEAAPERLPYTRAVIDEAMRLYPPAFAIVREALGPDVVAGRAVGRGTLLVVSPWVLHRHVRLWRAPAAFDPERFLPGAPPVDRFAYLPFGAGPRICIGAHFALLEATLVLAALVRRFRVELGDPRPAVPVAVVTTQPAHAPPFRIARRA